jgi:hypothetical protein
MPCPFTKKGSYLCSKEYTTCASRANISSKMSGASSQEWDAECDSCTGDLETCEILFNENKSDDCGIGFHHKGTNNCVRVQPNFNSVDSVCDTRSFKCHAGNTCQNDKNCGEGFEATCVGTGLGPVLPSACNITWNNTLKIPYKYWNCDKDRNVFTRCEEKDGCNVSGIGRDCTEFSYGPQHIGENPVINGICYGCLGGLIVKDSKGCSTGNTSFICSETNNSTCPGIHVCENEKVVEFINPAFNYDGYRLDLTNKLDPANLCNYTNNLYKASLYKTLTYSTPCIIIDNKTPITLSLDLKRSPSDSDFKESELLPENWPYLFCTPEDEPIKILPNSVSDKIHLKSICSWFPPEGEAQKRFGSSCRKFDNLYNSINPPSEDLEIESHSRALFNIRNYFVGTSFAKGILGWGDNLNIKKNTATSDFKVSFTRYNYKHNKYMNNLYNGDTPSDLMISSGEINSYAWVVTISMNEPDFTKEIQMTRDDNIPYTTRYMPVSDTFTQSTPQSTPQSIKSKVPPKNDSFIFFIYIFIVVLVLFFLYYIWKKSTKL